MGQFFFKQPGGQREHEQRQAELAPLPQHQAAAQGHILRQAKQPGNAHDGKNLERGNGDQQQHDPMEIAHHDTDIQHHADGDEKQPHQHIAKGADIHLHLMPEFRFPQHHTRHEGSQGQRQPEKMGQPCRRQGHQQYGEGEQFRGAISGDKHKYRPQQPTPRRQHQDHDTHPLRQRLYQIPCQIAAAGSGGGRHENQEGHYGDILKQQHTHRGAAVAGIQLHLLAQLLDHNGGGGHGEYPPQRDSRLRTQPQPPGGQTDHHGCAEHLGAADPQHFAAHGHQLGQRELQTHGKQQKHHAEFRQQMQIFAAGHQRQPVGTDDHADA